MKEATANHTRNLKRDRLLTEKERERLVDREDKSTLAINDSRIRKKLSNWLKTLDEVSLILNNLPEEQSGRVVSNEDAFELLCLAARAMKIKEFYPVDGIVSDPYTWDINLDRCGPLNHEKFNARLYKAKFGDYLAPSLSGMGKFDKHIISILQTGAIIDLDGLLKGLKIDPNDPDAVAIVKKQIEILHSFGLVENAANGWRWVNPKDSKQVKS